MHITVRGSPGASRSSLFKTAPRRDTAAGGDGGEKGRGLLDHFDPRLDVRHRRPWTRRREALTEDSEAVRTRHGDFASPFLFAGAFSPERDAFG